MIHYSGNRFLLKQEKMNPDVEASNSYSSFIRYLLSERLPSVTLEMIARLDIYQSQNFEEDLQKNVELQKIYQAFCEKGEVKKSEMRLAQKIIENSILKNMNDNPLQFSRLDHQKRYALVKSMPSKSYNDAFLKNISPSRHFDAWGVKNGLLNVHAVTTLYNFESQDLQGATVVEGIINGMNSGVLEKVEDFKVNALCKALLSNPDCSIENEVEFKVFNKYTKNLLEEGKIELLEFNALKYAPVDTEILKIMVEKADAAYDQMKGKLFIGFHSDESHPLTLKDREEQLSSSIARIHKATEVLSLLGKLNPSLDQIETAFGIYATDLSTAYTQARNAYILYGAKNKKLLETLNQTQKNIASIRQSCVIAKITAQYPQVGVFISPAQHVRMEKKAKNEQYLNEQKAISQCLPTDLQDLREKTAPNHINMTSSSMISKVLRGDYAKLTQSLLTDALLCKIEEIVKKDKFHPASCHQLAIGIGLGQNKKFDLSVIYKKLQDHGLLLEKLNQDYVSHLAMPIPYKLTGPYAKR